MATTPRKPKPDPCARERAIVERIKGRIDVIEEKLAADPPPAVERRLQVQLADLMRALAAALRALAACERAHRQTTEDAARRKPDPCADEERDFRQNAKDLREVVLLLGEPDLSREVRQSLEKLKRQLTQRGAFLLRELEKCRRANPPARRGVKKVAATRKAA